jgi:hypothetical protein
LLAGGLPFPSPSVWSSAALFQSSYLPMSYGTSPSATTSLLASSAWFRIALLNPVPTAVICRSDPRRPEHLWILSGDCQFDCVLHHHHDVREGGSLGLVPDGLLRKGNQLGSRRVVADADAVREAETQ